LVHQWRSRRGFNNLRQASISLPLGRLAVRPGTPPATVAVVVEEDGICSSFHRCTSMMPWNGAGANRPEV
jgi:hypothetical protein